MDLLMNLNEKLVMVRDFTAAEVLLRLFLSVFISGIIGLERGTHGHTAGFRTYILVCTGSTLAMLTNQFIILQMEAFSDMARLGAAVITGVGFLGVGTIIVTGRHRIKGLTTAAGLWAIACLGLAIGLGFYFGAILAALLIYIALALLPGVEDYFYERSRVLDLYGEIESHAMLKEFKKDLAKEGIPAFKMHISQTLPVTPNAVSLYFTIKVPRGIKKSDVLNLLEGMKHVHFVEEI